MIYCEWDVEVEFFVDNQRGFFVDHNFELLPFPFRNTCSRKAMEYEQTKAGESCEWNHGVFHSKIFPLKSDPFKKESSLSKVVLWQIRCHFSGSKGSHF